jgi:hypothetical protein
LAGYWTAGATAQSACVLIPSCDASVAPANGLPGNCTATLASGASCQPLCDAAGVAYVASVDWSDQTSGLCAAADDQQLAGGELCSDLASCETACSDTATCVSLGFNAGTCVLRANHYCGVRGHNYRHQIVTPAFEASGPSDCLVGVLTAATCAPVTYDKCAGLAGAGWTRVRHTATGGNWGPWTDQLSGGVVTGDPDNDGASWTVNFDNAVPGWNRFLFATGDCTKWLEATKDSVIGGYYSAAQRPILRSSLNDYAYSAEWYRREGTPEDPWISVIDHGPAIAQSLMLYGENNHGDGSSHASAVLNNEGADVYIKQ